MHSRTQPADGAVSGDSPDRSGPDTSSASPAARPEKAGPSLAQRKRQLVHNELGEAALRLLAANGYEQTTIEQIVAAAGVSRRTFFRYFRSKEDVIVASIADFEEAICAEVAARPAAEDARAAVRAALQVAVDDFIETPEKSVPIIRVTLETPALRARYLESRAVLQERIAAQIAAREGLDPATDLRPATVAGCALAAFDVALAFWVRGDGTADLSALFDEAFGHVLAA